MIKVSASYIYQTYKITTSTTASAAQQLTYASPVAGRQKVILYAKTADALFKFGADGTVAASATVTSNAFPAQNIFVPAGAIVELDLPTSAQHQYVSVINESGTGAAYIMLAKSDL